MGHKSTYETKFRRRREEKTNYRKRLALLKSGKHRLVVRKSLNYITVQIAEYAKPGDKIIASANSKKLGKYGWQSHAANTPSAYLTGFLCGMEAKKKGVEKAVLDIGLATPVHGSKIFAALKGAIDAGMEIPHDEKVFPKEDRVKGKHISEKVEASFNNVLNKIKAGSE